MSELIRDSIETTYTASFVIIFVWGGLYAVSGVALLAGAQAVISVIGKAPFSVGLILFAATSMIWSVPGSRNVAVALQLIGGAFVALLPVLLRGHQIQRYASIVLFALLTNLCVQMTASVGLGAATFTETGRWAGLTGSPNYLGALAFVSIPISMSFLMIWKRHVFIAFTTFCIASILLINSGSLTSLFCAIFSVLSLALLWFGRGRTGAVPLWFVLGVLLSAATLLLVAWDPETLLEQFGRSSNLTGRTGIWEAAIILIQERPMFGYGLGANTLNLGALHWATHFHNGLLDTAIRTGAVGAFLLIASFVGVAVRSFRRIKWDPSYIVACSFLGSYLLYNVSEAPVLLARHPIWILFLSFVFLCAAQRKMGVEGARQRVSP